MPTLRLYFHPPLLAAMLLFLSTAGKAQPSDLQFRTFTMDDGLPNPSISSILQDRRGFIWFGTGDGLVRFDGYRFKVWQHDPEDTSSLSDSFIYALREDSEGFIWIATNGGGLNRFDPATEQFCRYRHDPNDPESLSSDVITGICITKDGLLWLNVDIGMDRFDPKTGKFRNYRHDPADPNSLSHNSIGFIEQDKNGCFWISTIHDINQFEPETGQFTRFNTSEKAGGSFKGKYFRSFFEDKAGVLWIGTEAGINRFDPNSSKKKIQAYPFDSGNPNAQSDASVTAMLQDRSGRFWVATFSGGLKLLDPLSGTFHHFRYDSSNPFGLPSDDINRLCEDREGNLWVGSIYEGLSILVHETNQFAHLRHNPAKQNSLSDHLVTAIREDRNGILWIAAKKGGLDRFDPLTRKFQHFPGVFVSPSNSGKPIVFGIHEDREGRLWIATVGAGLYRMDRETGQFRPFALSEDEKSNFATCIFEDHEGALWVGTYDGVYRIRKSGKPDYISWKPENADGIKNLVYRIVETADGTIWIGTDGGGLFRFDRSSESLHPYQHNPADPHSLSHTTVYCLHVDKQGSLWAGTQNGLNRLDRKKEIFTRFTQKNGLPCNVVTNILEDGKGNLWLSTDEGLSRFDPTTGSCRNFDKSDGLPSNDFIQGAHFRSPLTGKMHFGSGKGLTIFHPDSLTDNPFAPPVVFTSFKRYQTTDSGLLVIEEKGFSERQALTLSCRDNILTLEFAALSFAKTAKNQYAYKLEGFNDQWISLGTKREVTFTNLDPGKYILRVKGSNGDGIWNEEGASLAITVTPPWWATWWAMALYLLAAASLLYGIRRYELKGKLAKAETLRLQELDATKTRLYTNITHEFRTPLTIISGMAEEIREHPQERLDEGLDMIKRNCRRLLTLVNQMLDLSKIESGNMPLHLVRSDVAGYLKYVVESFHSLAEAKKIRLEMQSDLPELVMDFDEEKLLQIVSNLLSNAIKFTPEGGEVRLSAVSTSSTDSTPGGIFQIKVTDTGIGIPPEKLPRIFDRFFQVESTTPSAVSTSSANSTGGTGIGLTLTKELVKLMGGEISVKSEPGKGTTFEVRLPVKNEASASERVTPSHPLTLEPEKPIGNFKLPPDLTAAPANHSAIQPSNHLLLIEDNPDVVRYLVACLSEGDRKGRPYRLDVARNGKEGVEKALETVPDLILSDVMMPEMDGFEVCRTLKNDERTSHIPLILLTAKADVASRLEGLERGADAYLAKPFEKEELQVWVRKLLELRRKLQRHYLTLINSSGSVPAPPLPALEQISSADLENAFVEKVHAMVEKHLNDHNFDLARFSREAAMSASQLHRKLVALTGLSPNRFIRHIRLGKAKMLLLETEETVSDIAYETGFSDPDYFIRAFRQEFGMPPAAFKKQAKEAVNSAF